MECRSFIDGAIENELRAAMAVQRDNVREMNARVVPEVDNTVYTMQHVSPQLTVPYLWLSSFSSFRGSSSCLDDRSAHLGLTRVDACIGCPSISGAHAIKCEQVILRGTL
jgi:hypothetical protein